MYFRSSADRGQRVNSKKKEEWLTIKKEVRKEQQEKEEEVPTRTTLP
jgi:hypothetical protein